MTSLIDGWAADELEAIIMEQEDESKTQNRMTPSDDRWKQRSMTYPGIARAMADAWGAEMGVVFE